MVYELEFSQEAFQFLDKLPKLIRNRIIRKLDSIREKPFSYVKKLKGGKLWRLRVGKYRILLDMLIKRNTIYVIRIGLRKNVYG